MTSDMQNTRRRILNPRGYALSSEYVRSIDSDPRLYNAAAASRIYLDSIPPESQVNLGTIYTDKNLHHYGKSYTSLADVRAGQISYYIDEGLKDAFFEPLYSADTRATGRVYIDPMGSSKPEWNLPHTATCRNHPSPLSFLQDSQFHREDMLALQMRRMNREKFTLSQPPEVFM